MSTCKRKSGSADAPVADVVVDVAAGAAEAGAVHGGELVGLVVAVLDDVAVAAADVVEHACRGVLDLVMVCVWLSFVVPVELAENVMVPRWVAVGVRVARMCSFQLFL